ncbi:hypothetical protein TIFTF001_037586 [Ficus carica]|uniref:Uncharacterized protein n=1 Tax=Ficus carica TaxID=3494 RepID=A0AA88E6E9_FICCA|nr:hypothetical protein TIFTF001_037586 [Ficus carica]
MTTTMEAQGYIIINRRTQPWSPIGRRGQRCIEGEPSIGAEEVAVVVVTREEVVVVVARAHDSGAAFARAPTTEDLIVRDSSCNPTGYCYHHLYTVGFSLLVPPRLYLPRGGEVLPPILLHPWQHAGPPIC